VPRPQSSAALDETADWRAAGGVSRPEGTINRPTGTTDSPSIVPRQLPDRDAFLTVASRDRAVFLSERATSSCNKLKYMVISRKPGVPPALGLINAHATLLR
jgi:hypothetical protein